MSDERLMPEEQEGQDRSSVVNVADSGAPAQRIGFALHLQQAL